MRKLFLLILVLFSLLSCDKPTERCGIVITKYETIDNQNNKIHYYCIFLSTELNKYIKYEIPKDEQDNIQKDGYYCFMVTKKQINNDL